MNIDTNFDVGDIVFYLDGESISCSNIKRIAFESDYEEGTFVLIYYLVNGLQCLRNNYPKWDRHLFKNKEELIKFLKNQ